MARHGRYTVVRKLANGGMAEIFLASQQGHEGFQKPVVLKRILGTIYADPQFRNMMIDEAHISMSLTHSNIVQVLDLGLAGGRYFLVLELVDGWDLGQVLKRAKADGMPLPVEIGLFILAETCRGLAYAHGKRGVDGHPLGIVHRDVSPNNVLISEHGEVKLADFGIAKAMNKREHTGTGVVKGKVAFMSPEQALGKPIDGRSDLFSLGSLLYVLMLGVRPFEASTDLETLLRVQRAEFKPPVRVRPDIDPEVSRIILKSMRFAPEDRYQTADEMLLDIERVLRTQFGGAGQTELKYYLNELSRIDGLPPIGRAAPVLDEHESSGAELIEGNAVVLADDATEAGQDDLGSEKTDLASLTPSGEVAGRRRRTVELGRFPSDMGGRELTPSRSSRRNMMDEFNVPEGAVEEAPPVRYGRNKGRTLPVLFVLVLLGGGGYVAARQFGWAARLGINLPPSTGPAEAAPTTTLAPEPPPAPPPAAKVADKPAPREREAAPAPPPEHEEKEKAQAAAPEGGEAVADPGAPRAPAPRAEKSEKSERAASRPRGDTGSSDVFKDSRRRVRSISEGLELPPGAIEIRPPEPAAPSPPPPPPPAPPPSEPAP
jgi:tRNA A-37 threonylcarbamoyl transferase component Bud32